MTDERLPVMLLTGFLGSGKTTLLNAWLQSPDLGNAAVIVNKFGDIGIVHALVASSSDNTIELNTGCLCCTVRGDLVDTLRELQVKRVNGETTGLADPSPVIQAPMTFPVAGRYQLRQVVTTVDSQLGFSTIDQHAESVKQAVVADDIVLTKTDLGDTELEALLTRLTLVNPGARIHRSSCESVPQPSALKVAAEVFDAIKQRAIAGDTNASSPQSQGNK